MGHFVVNNIIITETETISGTSFRRKNILLIELLIHLWRLFWAQQIWHLKMMNSIHYYQLFDYICIITVEDMVTHSLPVFCLGFLVLTWLKSTYMSFTGLTTSYCRLRIFVDTIFVDTSTTLGHIHVVAWDHYKDSNFYIVLSSSLFGNIKRLLWLRCLSYVWEFHIFVIFGYSWEKL